MKQKGFSIIEAIIVLMIVGIFLAIALPTFQRRNDVKPTPEQKMEAVQSFMARKEKFIHLCDTNGGVKDYNDHSYCGRGCSRPTIECNNGLSATFNR